MLGSGRWTDPEGPRRGEARGTLPSCTSRPRAASLWLLCPKQDNSSAGLPRRGLPDTLCVSTRSQHLAAGSRAPFADLTARPSAGLCQTSPGPGGQQDTELELHLSGRRREGTLLPSPAAWLSAFSLPELLRRVPWKDGVPPPGQPQPPAPARPAAVLINNSN